MPPIPPPLAEGFTTTTAVPLYWSRYAPRAPFSRLVVLHGGPGAHHDYLLPQMLDLAQERACLFYDQRGGGRSKTDDRTPITWRTHVEDLTARFPTLFDQQRLDVGRSPAARLDDVEGIATLGRFAVRIRSPVNSGTSPRAPVGLLSVPSRASTVRASCVSCDWSP